MVAITVHLHHLRHQHTNTMDLHRRLQPHTLRQSNLKLVHPHLATHRPLVPSQLAHHHTLDMSQITSPEAAVVAAVDAVAGVVVAVEDHTASQRAMARHRF